MGRDMWPWESGHSRCPWDDSNRQGGFLPPNREGTHRISKEAVERECLLSQSREKTSLCPPNELGRPSELSSQLF